MRTRVIFAAGSAASAGLGRIRVAAGATASDLRNVLRFMRYPRGGLGVAGTHLRTGARRGLVYSEIPTSELSRLTQLRQDVQYLRLPFQLGQWAQMRVDIVPVQAPTLAQNDGFHVRYIPRSKGE